MPPLKVAVIGAGGITYAHVPGWLAMGAEVSVYAEVSAHQLATRFGVRVCSSFDEAVSGADIVDICTPTPWHVEHTLRALAAGKNVICEKPVARTSADAARVERAAAEAGLQVFPGHVVRYFPELVAVKKAVEEGRLGNVAILRFNRQGSAPSSDWFFDESASGGLILDQMIHDLDAARWIAGEVVRVYAVGNPASEMSRPDGGIAAQVVLTHSSGAISIARGAWMAPGLEFSTSFDIAGDCGRLSYDSRLTHPLRADILGRANQVSYVPGFLDGNPYQLELEDFVGALEDGRPARVSYLDGVVAVLIAEAAIESMHTGRPIDVDENSVTAAKGVSA